MPSCSASDAYQVDGVPPTAGGATMNAAAADAVTDASAPAPRGLGCWRERCRNEQHGGAPCPPGICQRDEKGNPSKWHARPPCPGCKSRENFPTAARGLSWTACAA